VAHCIAPDLIGFGQSGKPDIEYRFADHVRYLDAILAAAGISSAFVLAHDWGTALAFHLAARRPEFIRGLAFMEFLSPMPTLLFAGNPGALVSPAFAESFAEGLKNCRVVQLSSGIHYLQEDHPEVIGAAVKEWLIDMGVGSSPKHKVAS
jgi:pimeloyl-ACP methyl ester carboxylesterase